jgi:hypothetical protein
MLAGLVLIYYSTVQSIAGCSHSHSKLFSGSPHCSGSCEPGSRCHPNECIFGGEKPRGVRILEAGVYEQGKGNGEVSLQANGDQGGRILSQLGGFQVSEGDRKGEQGELARGDNKARGMRHVH